jgi:Protein of unknown function (DUF4065)
MTSPPSSGAALPGVGKKKIHKLLYYAHGHHLADLGTPLFSENVRAWRMGPVVGSLWQEEDRGEPAPEPHELSEVELDSIGYTISRYGNLNSSGCLSVDGSPSRRSRGAIANFLKAGDGADGRG